VTPTELLNDGVTTVTEHLSQSDRVIPIDLIILQVLCIASALVTLYVDVKSLQVLALRTLFFGLFVLAL
jgi:hypothetical protein